MLPLHVLDSLFEEVFIKLLKIFELGNRHKKVPAAVTDFVLHMPFFLSARWIAKVRFKAIMQGESFKVFCYFSFAVF